MANDPTKPAGTDGAPKITPKDAASSTAVGSASRLGSVLHKSKAGTGTAAGAGTAAAGSGIKKKKNEHSALITALVTAGLTIGTLVLMIVFGKK
jgi:hypothetical protein